MATAVGSSQTGGPSQDKMNVLKELFYNAIVDAAGPNHAFGQDELLQLGIIENNNVNLLLQVCQQLNRERLLKAVHSSNQDLAFSWRSREDAKKYSNLTAEQAIVYELIDNAGADGIWSRGLRTRTRLVDSKINKILKELEQKGLIRDMKSVENPSKKMYIKASLRPSERATGGAWYTDSALDQAFIGVLEKFVFDFVRNKSTYLSKQAGGMNGTTTKAPRKGVVRGDADVTQSKKRSSDTMLADDKDKPTTTTRPAKTLRTRSLQPFPAGYTDYPTARQIAEHIDKTNITKNVALSEADIQMLIDVLVYEGVLEPITLPQHRGIGYRICEIPKVDTRSIPEVMAEAQAQAKKEGKVIGDDGMLESMVLGPPDKDTALTEAPCGRCPVFDLCEDGGPVSPSNCVYFNRWLGLEES